MTVARKQKTTEHNHNHDHHNPIPKQRPSKMIKQTIEQNKTKTKINIPTHQFGSTSQPHDQRPLPLQVTTACAQCHGEGNAVDGQP